MVNVVKSSATSYLKTRRHLKTLPLLRGVRNASYFSTFEMQEKMLADTGRIDSYFQAIAKYVKEGDVVVDLGTGTGILAFLAHAQKPSKIYAVDHSSIIKYATAVADSNGLSGIKFVNRHSKSFRPQEKVDVIIQEIIGSYIFNENMVDCVLDLRNRILKEGGRILPNKFEVFFEPAQLRRESFIPLIWENCIYNIDFSCLEKAKRNQRIVTPMFQPHDIELLLVEPKPIISFDLESLKDAKQISRHWHYNRTALLSGSLNGFVLYFKAFFDEGLVEDTTPAAPYECFAQRRLPFYRARTVEIAEGDEIEVDLQVDDLTEPRSWRWSYAITRGGGSRS